MLVFLRNLRAHLAGPTTLVWDRPGAHRSAAARLRETGCRRIQIEWLPPYAPELNPVEHLWSHLKARRLANHGFSELDEIHQHARYESECVAPQQNLLRTFVHATRLPIRLR